MLKFVLRQSFLASVYFEKDEELIVDITAILAKGDDFRSKIAFDGMDASKFKDGIDPGLVMKMLTLTYPSGKGVFDLNFSVKKGEVMGYLGPNGAGKTTTIRALLGFMHPNSGTCSIGGLVSPKATY